MKMNKPLRAVLSIFLSVLMLSTSAMAGIQVFAASVEQTQAATEASLADALTDYANDASENNRFKVLEALGPIVSALTVKLASQPTVKNGALKGGTEGANFMGEIRDAVIAQSGAGSDEVKLALINELIPTVGGTSEFHSLANYRVATEGSDQADFILDEEPGDVTVSASRSASDAIADYSAGNIPAEVVTEYSITYHCAAWQKAAVAYTSEDGAITGAETSTYEFYYFSAKPTIDKETTDVSEQKAVIDAFTDMFGADEDSYNGAEMAKYLKNNSKLYTAADLADLAERGYAVFTALVDLGADWYGGIVADEWVSNTVADLLLAIDGACYTRALSPIVDRMNAVVDSYEKLDLEDTTGVEGVEDVEELYKQQIGNYVALRDQVEKYQVLLSKSDSKNTAAAANLAGLKSWDAYGKVLDKQLKDIKTVIAWFAGKLLGSVLDELAAAKKSDEETEADYREQYLNYVDAYLAAMDEGSEGAAEPAEFVPAVEYFDASLSDARLEYIYGVLAGVSYVLNYSLSEKQREEVEEGAAQAYPSFDFSLVDRGIRSTLTARNGEFEPGDIAYGAEAAVKAAYLVNVDASVDQLIETIEGVKAYLGLSDDVDALINKAVAFNDTVLFADLERQVLDAKAVYDAEGEINYVNADALKAVGSDINENIYNYLANGDDYARSLIYAPAASSAPTAGMILIAHAADSFDGVYDAVTDTVAKAAAWSRVNMEISGSTYTIRYGNTELDLARVTGENYDVNNARVNATISKLDNFLKSDDLTNLINLKKENPDGTESPYTLNGHEVRNLNELIEAVLRDKLYSDEIMNKLVGTIYPMICNLLKVQLARVFFYNNPHYNPVDLSTFNISGSTGSWGGGCDGMSGYVYLYFNGPQSTAKFKDLLHNAGLDIYPEYLANHMGAFPSVQSMLRSAANWNTPDQGTNYTYLGNFPGDWQAANYVSDTVVGYNPYLYGNDDQLDFVWGINGDETKFKNALTAIIDSILPVARIALGGKTNYTTHLGSAGYAISDDMHAQVHATLMGTDTGNINAALFVKARAGAYFSITATHGENGPTVYGYRDILAPIFEAFGVDNYSYNAVNLSSYRPGTDSDAATYVNGLMGPLKALITQVTTYPIDKILSILPTLTYALRNDAINGLLNNLTINMTIDLEVEDIDQASIGVSWLDADWILSLFKSQINNALPQIKMPVNVGGKIDLAGMLLDGLPENERDITDINKILKGLLAKSDNAKLTALVNSLPYINQTQLSELGTSCNATGSERTYGTRYFVPADKPDVLWWLLKYVGSALANETFRNSIMGMLISDEGDDDSIITTLLSAIGNDQNAFGAALIELFNPVSYAHAQYNQWTTKDASNSVLRTTDGHANGSSYVYLKYGNDWTYEKAEALVESTNDIFTTLLKDTLEKDGYASFADWLDTILGKGFHEGNVTNFIKFLVGIGDSLDNYQLNFILSRFTSQGLNIHAWADTFGYLYDTDETPAEERHKQPGQADYVNNFPGLVPTIVDKIDSATGEVVYNEETGEAEKDVKWTYTSGGTTYTFVKVLDNVALTAEERNQNRHAFQAMMGCIFQPLSPVIDILLSGSSGALFPTTANPNGVLQLLGNNGYETAIIPLFEALGVPNENIKTQSEFNALGGYDAKLTYVMDTAFDWLAVLDGASNSSNNVITNTMTKLVPNLLQFLESNGVSVTVRELAKPILTLVDTVRPLLGININNVLGQIVGDVIDQALTDPENIEFEFPKGAALLTPTNYYNISLRKIDTAALFDIVGKAINKANGATVGSANYFDIAPLNYGVENVLALEHSSTTGKSTVYPTRIIFSENGTDKKNRANAANILTVAVSMALDLVFEGTNIEAIKSLLTRLITDEEKAAKVTEYVDLVSAIKAVLQDTGSVVSYLREPNWFYIDGSSRREEDGEIVLPGRTIYYLRYGKGIDTPADLFEIQQLPDDVNLWTNELARKLIDSIPALADMAVEMLTKNSEAPYASASEFIQGIWSEKVGSAFSPKTIGDIAQMVYGFIPAEVMTFKDLLNVFLEIDLDTWAQTYLEQVDKTKIIVDEETGEETEEVVLDDETGEPVKIWQAKEEWQSAEPYATTEEFSEALASLLSPLDEILSWLLVGDEYKFFYSMTNQNGQVSTSADAQDTVAQDQIVLAGGQGYNRCLVPILEAFGCEPAPLTADDTGVSVLTYTITAILNKLDSVVNSDDPINAVLDLLPNLLYFINANGLTTSIVNLVAPIAPLITAIGPMLIDTDDEEKAHIREILADESISGYDKLIAVVDDLVIGAINKSNNDAEEPVVLPDDFSIGTLDLEAVLNIVKVLTGINVYDAVTMTVHGTLPGPDGNINYDVVTGYNYLENFYYGDIHKKASANGLDRYYAEFTDATEESKADLLTILIYTVFDVLNYQVDGEYPNDLAIGKLVDKDDPAAGAEKVAAIRNMLQIFVDETYYGEYDWFYFNQELSDYNADDMSEFLIALANGEADLSEYATTMNYILTSYLSYKDEDQTNLWNARTAAAIKDLHNDIINMIIAEIVKNDDDESNDAMTTASQYLNSIWERNNPLNKRLLCTIGGAVGNIFSQLDNETLAELIGVVLDIPESDWAAWREAMAQYTEIEDVEEAIPDEENTVYTPSEFVDEILDMFSPIGKLLDWLLCDKPIKVFYLNDNSAAINLSGSKGFEKGLLPILEVLECDIPEIDLEELDGISALRITLNALIGKLEAVLESDDPVETVVDMIPQLLYFVNANGLGVTLHNLLGPVKELLTQAATLTGKEEISDLVKLLKLDQYGIESIEDFRLVDLVKVVELILAKNDITLNLIDALSLDGENFLETFALGKLVNKTSEVTGDPYFTMEYNDDLDGMSMITILICAAFDVFNYEPEEGVFPHDLTIAKIINKDDPESAVETVRTIREMLHSKIEPEIAEYDWFYFSDEVKGYSTEEAAAFLSALASGEADLAEYSTSMDYILESYLSYMDEDQKNLWNAGRADRLRREFKDILDLVVGMIVAGDDDASNDDITTAKAYLNNLWESKNPLDKRLEYKVGKLIASLLENLDNDQLIDLLGVALGIPEEDWNEWKNIINQYKAVEDPDEEISDAQNTKYTPKQFINKVMAMLRPVGILVDWLMFGKDKPIEVFYLKNGDAAISLTGANGFEEGVLPILRVLECDISEDDLADLDGLGAVELALTKIIEKVMTVLDSDDPLKTLSDMVPQLLYFINANGLGVAVNNIFGSVIALVNEVMKFTGKDDVDIVSLLKLDQYGITSINDIRLGDVVDIAETILGQNDINLSIRDALSNDGILYLEKFAIGKLVKLDGLDEGRTYYTMEYNDDMDGMSMLTILICSAIDLFKYEGNSSFWSGLIGEDRYNAVINLMNKAIEEAAFAEYDWFYFDSSVSEESFSGVGSKVPVDYRKSTMGYLDYSNNWNLETVKYIQDNFYSIVDTVIKNASDYDSLSALIKDKYSAANLYSWETVNKIGAAVGNMVGDMDEVLRKAIAVVLDVDLDTWDKYINEENTGSMTRDAFINELISIVEPIDFLLNWLLADEDLCLLYTKDGYVANDEVRYDAIRFDGANGFMNAIVPILEALGIDLSDLGTLENPTGIDYLRYTAEKLLGEIDTIVNDEDSVRKIVEKIPNLLYFINANGLSVSVRNLIVPVTNLLEDVSTLIGKPEYATLQSIVDELLKDNEKLAGKIDVENLDIVAILDIVEALTGLQINGSVTYDGNNLFETFAIGEVEQIESANGNIAYKMNYVNDTLGVDNSELAYLDVVTILVAAAVNIVRNDANKDALISLLGDNGANTYKAIRNVLDLHENDIEYSDYRWLFTVNNYTEIDSSVEMPVSPMERSIVFREGYDQYWTVEKADYVAENLNKVVDNTMRLLGIRINGFDLSDLETTLEFLLEDYAYTTGNAEKIAVKILTYIEKIDEIDPDGHIKALVKDSLGVDLNEYNKYAEEGFEFAFEDGDRDGFINSIIDFVRPLYPVLRWLLLDEQIAFFNDVDHSNLIVLPGGQGYNKAIIPLLEAFDYKNENIKTFAQYKADVEADEDNLIRDILNPLLDFVDYITEDPLNHLLDRLPALIYFVNSDGLDTAFRNVLHPVYVILHAIEPLVKVDLYEVMNFNLEEMDMEYVLRLVINKLLPDYADEITEPALNSIAELTLGEVIEYTSKNGEQAFTMEYVEDEELQMAGKSDMITVVLRLALHWLTLPENQSTVKQMIKDNIPDAETQEYVLATYDTFIEYLAKPQGITMMMGLAYYVFFGWDVASAATLERLDETNDNWRFMIGMIDGSDDAYIQSFAAMMHKIFDKTSDVVDEEGVVSHGFIPMFQKIIDWLKSIINWFKGLFGSKA